MKHQAWMGVGIILPADLMPTVSTALPMTIGELCACNEAMDCLITLRNADMDTIENMEVME